jgi:hypothetical protein
MGSIDHNTSQLLTVKQLSERLNISTNFIYKRTCPASADPLPFIPVGRGKRFDLEKVRQHLESRQKNPSSVMFSGTDGIARVNGKAFRRMTRKRFQTGSVRLRKDRKTPWWEGFYWLDIATEDGQLVRKRKSVKLGLQSDVPSKRAALRKLSEILSEINDTNYRPKSAITFRAFVSKYRELKMETKKGTTRHGYEVNIRKHYLPFFGDIQLAEIDTELVQAFINGKAKVEKKMFNTLKNLKWGLSSIFAAALKYGYVKSNPVTGVDLPPEGIREQVVLPTADHLATLMDGLEELTAPWFGFMPSAVCGRAKASPSNIRI